MTASSSSTKYDTVAITIHWTAAVLMIIMVFFGEELMEVEGGGASASTFLPSMHVSLGVAILLLTLLRVAWRLMDPPPELPATMAPWEIGATRIVHGLFYVLMIGLPFTGWLAFPEFLSEEPALATVSIFGLLPLPTAPNFGGFAGEVHEIGSKVAMALIILHVLAALKHQFYNRDGLLKRMSPR